MLAFDQLTCVRTVQNHLVAAPSACDFQKVYLRSIRSCNKCQLNLIYFQRFDIMFSLSCSPKVGICPIKNQRFGSRCQTLQYNPRSCYMQTRWPTNPTIFLAVRFFTGSQLPITDANILRMKQENISSKFCNRRTGFGKKLFLAMRIETIFVHPMIATRCS